MLNRANARLPLFERDGDYEAFESVLESAVERFGTRLTAYCYMPNHWHLVVWPRRDGELSAFVRWVTLTHTQRWHAAHESAGTGHLYQGRFKSFPVAADEHYLMLCRYVERNGLRTRLVRKAENWRWGSAWRRYHADAGKKARAWLAAGPVELPRNCRAVINTPQSEAELEEGIVITVALLLRPCDSIAERPRFIRLGDLPGSSWQKLNAAVCVGTWSAANVLNHAAAP